MKAFVAILVTLVFSATIQSIVVAQDYGQPADPERYAEYLQKVAEANAELDSLAQQLAKVLSHPGFRGFLRSEIAKSKNSESILVLDAFLERGFRKKGGDLPPGLQKLRDDTKRSRNRIKTMDIAAMEGFDLYFPVPEHKEKWKGNTDFFVAYTPYTDEKDVERLIAYSVATGEKYALDPIVPPDTPVLIIAPEEHDTHEIRAAPNFKDQPPLPPQPRGAERDGTPQKLQDYPGGNSHIRIAAINITDRHEPWSRGNPEIMAIYGDLRNNQQHSDPVNRLLVEPNPNLSYLPPRDLLATRIDLYWVDRTNYWYNLGNYMRYPFDVSCSDLGILEVWENDGGWYYYVYSTKGLVGMGTPPGLNYIKHSGDDRLGSRWIRKSYLVYDQFKWRFVGAATIDFFILSIKESH